MKYLRNCRSGENQQTNYNYRKVHDKNYTLQKVLEDEDFLSYPEVVLFMNCKLVVEFQKQRQNTFFK